MISDATRTQMRVRLARVALVGAMVGAMVGTMVGTILVRPGTASAQSFDWKGEDADRWISRGGYFVIGGSTGWEQFDDVGGQDFDAALGLEIRGGARLNKYLAIEVAGDFLSGFETTVDLSGLTPAPTGPAEVDLTLEGGNVTANILAYFPLGRIQPYALLGLGGMWARLRTTDTTGVTCDPLWYTWYCTGTYTELDSGGAFVMKFGGGSDFYITKDWALTLDVAYVKPFGDLDMLDYLSLGWGLRFNF